MVDVRVRSMQRVATCFLRVYWRDAVWVHMVMFTLEHTWVVITDDVGNRDRHRHLLPKVIISTAVVRHLLGLPKMEKGDGQRKEH